MARFSYEFENSLFELEKNINSIKDVNLAIDSDAKVDLNDEVYALEKKANTLAHKTYKKLSSWERVQIARHPDRPHSIDYINAMLEDFHEVSGDRKMADDESIIAGFGFLDGQKVAVIGIEKGRKTAQKIKRNFGMPKPEGYGKALRVMQLAGRFNIPIITLVDTPGAYPGISAEERGQALAIANNLAEIFDIKTPIIAVVIGEGGSGGALGIAIADVVMMMEYSVYSVISPESCASILWSDSKKAKLAATALNLSPDKALELEVIDKIIAEPLGGAHNNAVNAIRDVKTAIIKELKKLLLIPKDLLIENRYEKFRVMGNKTLIS